MRHFDKDLKMYAENGLRSAQDWLTWGRQVEDGQTPRASITCRGQLVELFTREQTRQRQRSITRP